MSRNPHAGNRPVVDRHVGERVDAGLVGRQPVVDELVERIGRGDRHWVVAGPAGIGKSSVIRAVAAALRERADDDRTHLIELCATPILGDVPFGAFAAFVPVTESPAGAVAVAVDVDVVCDLVSRPARGRQLVLVVDDWPLLDKGSVAVIDRLVERHGAALLATLCTDERSTDAESGLRARDCEVVALRELDRGETATMAGDILGGVLAKRAAGELWRRSGGIPLFIRELVVDGRESGALQGTDGTWRYSKQADVPTRVTDLVALRLGRLPPEHHDGLVVLAVAGELSREIAESLIGSQTLNELASDGWLRTGKRNGFGVVGVGHPLVDEAIRATISPVVLATTSRRLAGAVGDRGDRFDVLQVARWHIVGGVDAASALWLDAAKRARVLGEVDLATQFAEAAVATSPGGLPERLALAEVVTMTGDFQRAEDIAETLQSDLARELERPSPSSPHVDLFRRVAISRAFNAYWGIGDLAIATETLDTATHTIDAALATDPARLTKVRLELQAERAAHLAFSGSMVDGLACAERVLRAGNDAPHPVARAALAAGSALMQLGRPLDAATHLRAGLDAVELIPTYGRGQFTTVLMSSLALALVECGDALGAVDVAVDGMRRAACSHDGSPRALAGFALGRAALARGHVDEAARAFRDATAVDVTYRAAGNASWSLVGLARAEALRGSAERADQVIAEIADLPPTDDRFWCGELDRAKAWARLAAAEMNAATDLLERAYGAAVDGDHVAMAAWLAHDLLRVRGNRADVDRVLVATEGLDQGVFPMLRGHALAVIEGPDHQRECADAFATGGFDLIAAEICFRLADRQRRDGLRRDAATAKARGDALLEACGAVRTPALVFRSEVGGLTARQRQIVHLAASGLSNPEIASRLSISVRTVANQLQRAYEATGLTRSQLPRLA